MKLARRPTRPEERKHKNDNVKTLIELPKYGIIAPSNGSVHPSGKAYVRESGDLTTVAQYTDAEQRDMLLGLARSLDEMEQRPPVVTKSPAVDGTRPGDAFNAATTWPELLGEKGWRASHSSGPATYWTRPGKKVGVSATTNFKGNDLFHVFTTSTEFDPDKSYDRFALYAITEHGGDFGAAARALASQGYGAPTARADAPMWEPLPAGHNREMFSFRSSDQFDTLEPREQLIEGEVNVGSLAYGFGAPESAKSTLETYKSFCFIEGRPYLGKQVKQGLVVWVAGEDADGAIERYVGCYRYHKGTSEIPLVVVDEPVNMLDPADVALLQEFITATEQRLSLPVVYLTFDTIAEATPGSAYSDGSKEYPVFARHCRQVLRQKSALSIGGITHAGKDPSRGAIGSISLRAAADAEYEITKTGDIISIKHTKSRSYRRAPDRWAKIVSYDLIYKSGEVRSVPVVCEPQAGDTPPTPKKKTPKLQPHDKIIEQALEVCQATEGKSIHAPNREDYGAARVVDRDTLRTAAIDAGFFPEPAVHASPAAKHSWQKRRCDAFNSSVVRLTANERIKCHGIHYWRVKS